MNTNNMDNQTRGYMDCYRIGIILQHSFLWLQLTQLFLHQKKNRKYSSQFLKSVLLSTNFLVESFNFKGAQMILQSVKPMNKITIEQRTKQSFSFHSGRR